MADSSPSSAWQPHCSQSHSPVGSKCVRLYLAVPVFFAAAFHGTVLGALTTLAAIIGLVAVATTGGAESIPTTLPLMAVFYALIGITFSQARRVFIEEPEERTTTAHYRRLESAHALLADLASLAGSAELNPVTIGQRRPQRPCCERPVLRRSSRHQRRW